MSADLQAILKADRPLTLAGVPALLALGTEIELISRAGKRQLPLPDFILGPRKIALRPDEIVSAILIPKPKGAAHSSFVKLGRCGA